MRGVVFPAESEFGVFSENNDALQVCSSFECTSFFLFSGCERKQRSLWRQTILMRSIVSEKEHHTFQCVGFVIFHYFFSPIHFQPLFYSSGTENTHRADTPVNRLICAQFNIVSGKYENMHRTRYVLTPRWIHLFIIHALFPIPGTVFCSEPWLRRQS